MADFIVTVHPQSPTVVTVNQTSAPLPVIAPFQQVAIVGPLSVSSSYAVTSSLATKVNDSALSTNVAMKNANILMTADNAFDIGATASGRPRNVNVAGALTVAGTPTFNNQLILTGSGNWNRLALTSPTVNISQLNTSWGQGYLLLVNLDVTGSLDPLTALAYTQNPGASNTGGAYFRIDGNSKVFRFGIASTSPGSGSSATAFVTESFSISQTGVNVNGNITSNGALLYNGLNISPRGTLHTFGGVGNASTSLTVNANTGSVRQIILQSNGFPRWGVAATSTAETGGDAGSNFNLTAYNDAGGVLDIPLSINRASGSTVVIARPLYSSGSLTINNNIQGAQRRLNFTTNNTLRWGLVVNQTTEAGSNSGSDWQMSAYDDAGAVIDTPWSMTRAAGGFFAINRPFSVANNAFVNGTFTATGSTTHGSNTPVSNTIWSSNPYVATFRRDVNSLTAAVAVQFNALDSAGTGTTYAGLTARIEQSASLGTYGQLWLQSVNNGTIGDRWGVVGVGHLLAASDNTYDIGSSANNRPRNLYVAGTVTGALGASFGVPAVTNGDTLIANSLTVREGTSGNAVSNITSNALAGFSKLVLNNTAASGSTWEVFVGGWNTSGTNGAGINEGNLSIRVGGGAKFWIDKVTGQVTAINDLAVSGSARFVNPAYALYNANSGGNASLTVGVPGSSQGVISFGNANTATGLGTVGFASGSPAGDFQISSGGGAGTIRLVLPSGGGDVAKFASGSAAINSPLYVSASATILGAGIVNAIYNKVTVRGDHPTVNTDLAEIGFVRSNYNPGENAAAIVFSRETGAAEGALSFRTQNANASLTERLRIGAAGLVTATNGLTVTGSLGAAIQTSGTTNANAAVVFTNANVSPAAKMVVTLANDIGQGASISKYSSTATDANAISVESGASNAPIIFQAGGVERGRFAAFASGSGFTVASGLTVTGSATFTGTTFTQGVSTHAGQIVLSGSLGGLGPATRYIGHGGSPAHLYLNASGSGQVILAAGEVSLLSIGASQANINVPTIIGGTLTATGTSHALGATGNNGGALILNANTGSNRDFQFQSNGLNRWVLRVTNAETGTNSGADFQVISRDDTGAFLDTPIAITRAQSGGITLGRTVLFSSDNAFDIGALGSGRVHSIFAGTAMWTPAVGGVSGTPLTLYSNGSGRWIIDTSGNLVGAADNTYDIGNAGNSRPRNLNVAGNITAGGSSHALGATGLSSFNLTLNANTGSFKGVTYLSNGLNRWSAFVNGGESTGNVGANYSLSAYDDAGTIIDTPLSIVRAAGGAITLNRSTTHNGPIGVNGGFQSQAGILVGSTFPIVAAGGGAFGISVVPQMSASANNDALRGIHITNLDSSKIATGSFSGVTVTGLNIGAITGGASNFAIQTSTGKVSFGDTVLASNGMSVTGSMAVSGPAVTVAVARTPTSSADAIGSVGDISRDDNFVYVKTSTGWKRAALTTF